MLTAVPETTPESRRIPGRPGMANSVSTPGDMLIAYLPKEKILFNADLYSPPAQGAAPAAPTPGMRTLQQNIRKLKLDVVQHAPAHGRVGTNEEFMKLVAPASTARAN